MFDGFVVSGGNADGALGTQDRGAAMNVSGSPQIVNCVFRYNTASGAGAINIGAVGNPSIRLCTFVGNRATGATTFNNGGAVHVGGNAEIGLCMFAGNVAISGNGGAVSVATGATVSKVYGSVFSTNIAVSGGALQLGPAPVVNCTFSRNSASGSGGAINVAPTNNPPVTNCILWEDNALVGGREVSGSAVVTYCCIKEGMPGAGNFDLDPVFLNSAGADQIFGTADDDCRIASGPLFISPCIDAGNSVAAMSVSSVDLDGAPRFFDNPYVTDTGIGPGFAVDLGAYEPKAKLCDVDINGDGSVNPDDLGDFINAYFTGCQ